MFGNITIQAEVSCTYITTPRALRHTVWRIELICYCAMQSMLCRQWLTREDNTDNHNNVCAFVHQPTHIRAWLASGRVGVVGATITGALWGCLVSLQVGQESSSVYAMCPPSSSRSPNTMFFPSVNLFDPTIGNGHPPEIPSPEKFGEGLLCPEGENI